MFKFVRISIFILLLFTVAKESFAASVLSGGDTDRKYAVGVNFMGGSFGFQFEVEGDIRLSRSISIAPRLGGTALGGALILGPGSPSGNFAEDKLTSEFMLSSFFLGVSARFAIIRGIRPHGFWIGPSLDIVLGTNTSGLGLAGLGGGALADRISKAAEAARKALSDQNTTNTSGTSGAKFAATFAPSAEFGWRYTFNFGLSLQAMLRLGLYINTNLTLGFYGLGGVGVGYVF